MRLSCKALRRGLAILVLLLGAPRTGVIIPFGRLVRSAILLLASLAVLLGAVGQASADTIYSSLGPGDSYNNRLGAWTESGPNSFLGAFRQAESFRVPAGSDYTFQGARLALGLANGGGPNEIDLRLYADAGGKPGAILETIHASGQMPPLFMFFSGHLVTFESTQHPTLLAGQTYWLLPFTSDVTRAAWNWNEFGQGGPLATSQKDEPTDWVLSGGFQAAFDINASLGAAPVVPEPSTLTMVGLGVTGLLVYGRRRKPAG